MMSQASSPHTFKALDRVIRNSDAMRGQVLVAETLRAIIAWDDGTVALIDQFDPAVRVEERGVRGAYDEEELESRRRRLEEELSDVQWEISSLEDRAIELESEISEVEDALERAKEARQHLEQRMAEALRTAEL